MALQDNVCQPIMISQTRALLCYAAKMEDKRNLYKKKVHVSIKRLLLIHDLQCSIDRLQNP